MLTKSIEVFNNSVRNTDWMKALEKSINQLSPDDWGKLSPDLSRFGAALSPGVVIIEQDAVRLQEKTYPIEQIQKTLTIYSVVRQSFIKVSRDL